MWGRQPSTHASFGLRMGNRGDMTPAEPTEPPDVGSLDTATAGGVDRGARERDPDAQRERPQGMLPARERRRTVIERGFMRLVATGGIIGIAVALGAILVSQDVAGWIIGLVIGVTSVVLSALLWSSRQL